MARTATPVLKNHIDSSIGTGGAAKILAAINSSHTAFDSAFRTKLAKILGGVGEATAFETACTTNAAPSVAAMNRLEHELHGRGNAEELRSCILDGTIT